MPVDTAWQVLSRRRHAVWMGGPTRGITYLAADPLLFLLYTEGRLHLVTGMLPARLRGETDDPFAFLHFFLSTVPLPTSGPVPFCGGIVVAINYDARRFLMPPRKQSAAKHNPLGVSADMALGFYDVVYAYEHRTNTGWLAATGVTPDGGVDRVRAEQRLDEVERLLETPVHMVDSVDTTAHATSSLDANMSGDTYVQHVHRALDYISAGDIYQLNLSLLLSGTTRLTPATLSDCLRARNPSPYHTYLDAGPWQLVSNSPERFLTVHGRTITTSPIKGTRPRGRDRADDFRLIDDLRTSEKELAELRMIVDLERNDLGRICEIGSVTVTNMERVETYSHVHHLMTDVEGRLREDVGPVDMLRATFPGGSITGCPKIRAMDIIEELEPHRRGLYTGAVGFITGDGLDLNIAIRTALLKATGRPGEWHIALGVGSGIVADSEPVAEYDETLTKAQAFADVLDADIA